MVGKCGVITACEKYNDLKFLVIPQEGFTAAYTVKITRKVLSGPIPTKNRVEDKLGRLNQSSHGQIQSLK